MNHNTNVKADAAASPSVPQNEAAGAPSNDFYELRLYTCRPGRIPDMHHRMGYEVVPLFDRHGIPPALAYWEGLVGEFDALYAYLLRWTSLDQRFRAFKGFYADPDWLAQKTASDAGEFMLERLDLLFLRPLLDWDAAAFQVSGPGCVHELRWVPLASHGLAESKQALLQGELPFFRLHGAAVLGAFTVEFGAPTPRAAVLLSWPSFEARDACLLAHERDPALRAQRDAEHTRSGRSLLGAARSSLMLPARYQPLRRVGPHGSPKAGPTTKA